MEGEAAQLNNLRKFLKKEQYGKALEICDKSKSPFLHFASLFTSVVLEQNPADIDLYKVKILCCIHLQKFDNALEIADFNGEFAFEKAYCLYRKNQVHLLRSLPLTSCFKLNEALSVCNSVKSKSDDILNLMAQTVTPSVSFSHYFSFISSNDMKTQQMFMNDYLTHNHPLILILICIQITIRLVFQLVGVVWHSQDTI